MIIRLIEFEFAICKVPDFSEINLDRDFSFLSKTDEEYSIVCPTEHLPSNCSKIEQSWRAFRVEGQLDFSLIGIIARISTLLADQEIGIFVVSTFNTDYFLVRSHQLEKTIDALENNGYRLIGKIG